MARKKKETKTSEPAAPAQPQDLNAMLAEWYALTEKLENEVKPLVKREMELRKAICAHCWPGIQEGTQHYELAEGWKLTGILKLTYNVDEAALPAVMQQCPEGTEDFLIHWKPSLRTAQYRLVPEQYAPILAQCIEIKPASPALELVAPG